MSRLLRFHLLMLFDPATQVEHQLYGHSWYVNCMALELDWDV